MRCRGIQPFKQKNGKGNEDDVHHVPAPSSIFQLKRKPMSCPVTPLDGGRSKVGSSERKSISCLSTAHGFLLACDQSQSRAAGFQDGCIRQKRSSAKESELDESWWEFNLLSVGLGKVIPNTGVDGKKELHSVAV